MRDLIRSPLLLLAVVVLAGVVIGAVGMALRIRLARGRSAEVPSRRHRLGAAALFLATFVAWGVVGAGTFYGVS